MSEPEQLDLLDWLVAQPPRPPPAAPNRAALHATVDPAERAHSLWQPLRRLIHIVEVKHGRPLSTGLAPAVAFLLKPLRTQ